MAQCSALSVPVWLVRHACAGEKDLSDSSNDDMRPLDPTGQQQARALAVVLSEQRPRRLFSSPTRRCVDTLTPLAAALHKGIEPTELLARGHAEAVAHVLRFETSARCVFYTHGEVMQPVLELLQRNGLDIAGGYANERLLLKGVAWMLRFGKRTNLTLVAPLEVQSCPFHPDAH
jgi:8-oxo-dGTP diphosphatase